MSEIWTPYEYGGTWFIGAPEDDSGPIMTVHFTGKDRERAHLAAAAPELLHALKLFVDAVKYNRLYVGFEKAFEVGSELVERLEGCK